MKTLNESYCRKCQADTENSKFCDDCHYPGIEEDYQEYRDLITEGHPRAQAAVLSGWLGAEEI